MGVWTNDGARDKYNLVVTVLKHSEICVSGFIGLVVGVAVSLERLVLGCSCSELDFVFTCVVDIVETMENTDYWLIYQCIYI